MSDTSSAPQLRVTLVQTSLHWHDAAANRRHFDELLADVGGATDLIVLPEMFTTGFTMAAAEVAEPPDGPSTDWMRSLSARTGAVVTGSLVTREGEGYFNRLVWMQPDGDYATYDKRHLFRMGREHQHYSAGDTLLNVTLKGWKIRPLVCYDLRFPVWSRNRIDTPHGYDVLVYVANWPERRRYPWSTLLRARAIENLSYCIGVNRIGPDATGVNYCGDSTAIDFLGQPLNAQSESEFVTTVSLDHGSLQAFRDKFAAHLDADGFQLC